ncbi:MAG: metallophosphoesterase family protein [Vicinamibacterales bacterium]
MTRTGRTGLTQVGVISDTHGLLRPAALDALRGVDLIIHAGDVGKPEILDALGAIAPTVSVRGNVDTSAWGRTLPETDVVDAGGRLLYVLHDRAALDLDPRAAGFAAVIFGHTHRPEAYEKDGVLYLNPGSAGPRRFSLPICLARLTVDAEGLRHEFIDLPA